jgi:hypothetical protein
MSCIARHLTEIRRDRHEAARYSKCNFGKIEKGRNTASKSERDSNSPAVDDEVVLLWFHVRPVSQVHSTIEERHIQIWKFRLVDECCELLCVVFLSPLARDLCRLFYFSLSLRNLHMQRGKFLCWIAFMPSDASNSHLLMVATALNCRPCLDHLGHAFEGPKPLAGLFSEIFRIGLHVLLIEMLLFCCPSSRAGVVLSVDVFAVHVDLLF